jgi:hypothetical protein
VTIGANIGLVVGVVSVSDHVREKGARLLRAGRVREVTRARSFVVEGSSGTYLVTVGGDGRACTSAAFVRHCSHVGRRGERPHVDVVGQLDV